ncbi:putative serine/threonine-protein kinase DDB_G0284251 OS=Dictyostelium discoideum GN=DDB_G0284251 PE=3 SV=1 [Rhizoctonia solani AG-1 IB]|uniref:Putative serine/threonine-protein kinase DDB_G0284251 n=1 Tax=Thanatephorus cucumeris (strain AG1-IB / isolate 7/3/14) TaxID=1108050 RepID=A0A0B7G332_THACB|nr:putative serine/threonine-protein kinase DDB_G0284251 OS=Dictyostelium discoideum GN=DDB_G0284251 PE=3 SV=1 [Rhizoctonia solani AG-1 IB]
MYTNQDARNSVTSTSTAYYSALSSFSSIRQSRSYSDFRLTSDTFKQLTTRTSQSRLGGRDIVASTPVLTPVIEDRKSTESQPDSVPPASPPALPSIPILDNPETEKVSETMVAVEHTSSSSNTSTSAPSDSTSYSQLTSTDMFRCLISHGCQDLTFLIDPDKYSSCRIAEGGFGDIWRGQMYDGMSIAVKVLRCGQVTVKADERKGLKRMMREIYAWSKLDHDNVHKLLGVTIFQGRLGMVSQWLPQGNLRDYLIRSPGVDRYELCTQLSQSVVYIHDRDMVGLLRYLDILAQSLTNRIGQVHGDLKALNILVSPNGVIKLTDFDYSIITNCSLLFTDTTRVGGGTYRWMAPELFVKEGHQRSKETDVYALGMTFLEIITGTPPYHPQCKTDAQVMYKVTTGTLPTRPSDHFAIDQQGNAMWQLLTHCWAFDPASRPKALEVLNSLPLRLHPQEYAQSDYTKVEASDHGLTSPLEPDI